MLLLSLCPCGDNVGYVHFVVSFVHHVQWITLCRELVTLVAPPVTRVPPASNSTTVCVPPLNIFTFAFFNNTKPQITSNVNTPPPLLLQHQAFPPLLSHLAHPLLPPLVFALVLAPNSSSSVSTNLEQNSGMEISRVFWAQIIRGHLHLVSMWVSYQSLLVHSIWSHGLLCGIDSSLLPKASIPSVSLSWWKG